MPFVPHRVIFEEAALNYPIAKEMLDHFTDHTGIKIEILPDKKRISKNSGATMKDAYWEAKRTLVVGIRKTLKFQSCKPSAHYQLPLVTGCTGNCEYCYLNTQFGKNPYIRVYVNMDEILGQAALYISQRQPELTHFEGAAVSDPIPVEPYTGSLAAAIRFFADQEYGRYRFVTKFTEVDSLLDLEHRQKTTVRFSLNADHIIRSYEHGTPRLNNRIEAARKITAAEYPLGFIIGPVILFPDWKREYQALLENLKDVLNHKISAGLSFEVISHRFTARAKNTIYELFPETTLPLDEASRQFKYGQFGYGKYVYPKQDIDDIKEFFHQKILSAFPRATIKYII